MSLPLRIIFMGTPAFAVPSLLSLVQAGQDVALVCTQPDRPSGRGRKIRASPVKQAAVEMGLPVYQPDRLRDPDVENHLKTVQADVLVVVAFGQIVPPALLKMPPLGAINIHASLLPALRGPAPIQWSIIHQLPQTGVTFMQMDAGLDTGAILRQSATPISPSDTAATLHDRLAEMGASLLPETLLDLAAHRLTPISQAHSDTSYAPMLKKIDGRIDWQQPAAAIEALIRGVTPWPGAFSTIGGMRLKIFRARPESVAVKAQPGTVISEFPGELRVATGDGVLTIEEVQGASGKRMAIDAYLRGHPIETGTCFS